MSRARHEVKTERAKGGGIGAVGPVKTESYAGTGSETEKEAEKRKRGGKVTMRKGNMPHMVHGSAPKHHGNRPGRKSGGSVGADSHPMTAASKLSMAEGVSRDSGKVDREDD